ncbi:hypothetical protein IW245_000522 [Longispora fulva]|uniref:Uncharacterized protein n=1 Tax=Longispora fulva TaxID=619741 RepID=A0A8J7G611_9ACTN|nr:hypothetical protein [Longispora fulva]
MVVAPDEVAAGHRCHGPAATRLDLIDRLRSEVDGK